MNFRHFCVLVLVWVRTKRYTQTGVYIYIYTYVDFIQAKDSKKSGCFLRWGRAWILSLLLEVDVPNSSVFICCSKPSGTVLTIHTHCHCANYLKPPVPSMGSSGCWHSDFCQTLKLFILQILYSGALLPHWVLKDRPWLGMAWPRRPHVHPHLPAPFLWGRPTMLSSGISLWESESKMNALLLTSQLLI